VLVKIPRRRGFENIKETEKKKGDEQPQQCQVEQGGGSEKSDHLIHDNLSTVVLTEILFSCSRDPTRTDNSQDKDDDLQS